jgi:hypothetical protein
MNTVFTDVPVDHVVLYAGYELDALASFLERIGFQLTPVGRHSSGSINRLAMLEGQYIELMGFEPGTPRTVRPELQVLPQGLNGIVAADPAGRTRRTGSDGFNPPVHLERPVDTPHAQGIASFTITTVRQSAPDARTFMCRHHTPQLVWHEAWQQHANGATRVSEVRIPTRDPRKLHAAVRTIFDITGDVDAAAYHAAGTCVRVGTHDERGLLAVRARDVGRVAEVLQEAGVPYSTGAQGSLKVALPPPYAVDIVFEAGG